MIAFFVPGSPLAFARAGSNGKFRYTPAPQRSFMNLIKTLAADAMAGAPPMEGPIELSIRAVYPLPGSWSNKRKARAVWRTSRPDADDIGKIVCDSLNAIAFLDDAQVVDLSIQKKYGPVPGLTVSVTPLERGGE